MRLRSAQINRRAESLQDLSNLVDCSYEPTFDFGSLYIDEFHESIASSSVDGHLLVTTISGWLQPADALKIYEMAYFSEGDILELGTHKGLSTHFLARALAHQGSHNRIDTLDIDEKLTRLAEKNLQSLGLDPYIRFRTSDAADYCIKKIAEGKKYGFVFVDHSHAFEAVYTCNLLLRGLMLPNAFLLFHDFTDPRNSTRKRVGANMGEYGVTQACIEAFEDGGFDFLGTYGCCGLFRRHGTKLANL